MISAIRRNLLLVKIGGGWKSEDVAYNNIYRTLAFIHGFINVYSIIGCLIELNVDSNLTMEKFSLILFTICLSSIVFSRLIHLLYNHEEIKTVLQILDEDLIENNSINKDEEELITTADNLVRKSTNISIIASIVGAIYVCSAPLFEKLLYILNLPVPGIRKHYPFPIYVPFDDTNLMVYLCVYVSHVMTSFSILYIWVGSDIFLWSVLIHLFYHFKILGNRIKSLKYETYNVMMKRSSLKGENTEDYDKILAEKLKKAVLYHNDLFRLCEKLENLYSNQLLVLIICVTSLVCSCGFQIAVGTLDNASHIFAMIISITDISWFWFLACLFGSIVQSGSTEIANDLYSSEWIHFPQKHKIILQFMLARAQKPVTFTAGKFVNMTLAGFVEVVKMSYSFVAILRQMYQS